MIPPPLLIGAVACLVVAQVIGVIGLRMRLDLTATLAMLVLITAAVTLGVVAGLQLLPGRI